MSPLAAELGVVTLSFLICIVCYHVALWKGFGGHLRTVQLDAHGAFRDTIYKGRIARCEISESVCRDDDSILGIHQNHSCLLGAAVLATNVEMPRNPERARSRPPCAPAGGAHGVQIR